MVPLWDRIGTNFGHIQVLQNTRQSLLGKYKQVPQLSVGSQVDLNQPLKF